MNNNDIVRKPFVTHATPGLVIDTVPGGDRDYTSYTLPDGCGGEVWQLDVGAECNLLLTHAEGLAIGIKYGAATSPMASQAVVDAIRSIVNRVAEFEDLQYEYEMDSGALPPVSVGADNK